MPRSLGLNRNFPLARRDRTLLGAALLALGLMAAGVRAQVDVNAVRVRAEQGDPEALNALGNAHANGTGVPQDLAEALRYYQQAAERGLAAAHFNLGMMHELGRGVPPNPATAFRHYLKAAEQGFAPAQFNVGNMYANGLGVRQDYFEAALWFRQAADRNVAEAQYNLALAYELGRGVAKDEAAAQRWYRAAAAQRYPRAQYNLALMLEEGRGSSADPAAALELYRAAAGQNFAPAQNNLGILLAEGRGAPASPVEALAWLTLAAENGAKPAGRDIVARQLSSAQVAQAGTIAARLRAQVAAGGATTPASPIAASPVSSPAMPATPAASGPATETGALQARLADAEVVMQQLRAENARLASENSKLKTGSTAQATAAAAAAQLRTQLDELSRETAALRVEKIELQRQAGELASQLKLARAPAVATAESAAASPVDTSGIELSQLAAADPRIARLISESARLNDEVKRSTIELTNLTRQLRTAQEKAAAAEPARAGEDAPGAELARQLEELRAANQKLADENRRLAAAGDAAAPGPAPELAQLRQENEQLRRAAAGAAEVARQRDALIAAKDALESRIVDLSNRVSGGDGPQLRAQLAAAQAAQAEAARKLATQESAARAEQERLSAQLAELQRTARAQPPAPDTGAVRAERDQLARDKNALEQKLRQSRTEASEMRALMDKVEEANRSLGAQVDALTVERARLAATASKPAAGDGAVEKLSAQLDAAGRSIAELKARNESVQKDLEVARQSAAAALAAQAAAAQAAPSEAMKLELQTLENHVRTVETQLEEDRKNSARELSALAGQLQNSRESNRALMEANRALLQARGSDDAVVKTQVEDLSAKLKLALTDLEKTRAEHAALEARLGDSSRAAEQHGASVAELTGLNERLGSEKAALERQVTEARMEIAELKRRADSSENAAEERVAAMDGLTKANEKLEAQVKTLGEQLQSVRSENARLAAAGENVASVRSELAELRTKLGDAQKTAEQHAGNTAELTGANERLSNELREVQSQLTASRAENVRLAQSDQAKQEAEQRAASLSAAAAQFATSQRDLAAARAEISRLTETVQVLDRDRSTRVAQLQQENAAIAARLRQAQGTLDQIASAARLIHPGNVPVPAAAVAPTNAGSTATPTIPATSRPAPPAAPSRVHVVAEGDSLTRISARYYGTGSRWQEIYEANRDVLRGENALRPGQRLRIP